MLTQPNTDADRPNALRLALLGFAVGALILTAIALACGPAAPGGQSGGGATPTPAAEDGSHATPTPTYTTGGTASASELATLRAIPTATPYPPGYVKPTDLPTYTPIPSVPTLKAQMEREQAELWTREAQTGAADAGGENPDQDWILQTVVEHIARGEYDAIAKVRIGSIRNVRIPGDGIDPSSRKFDVIRHTVEVITTYRGSLPAQFDVVSYAIESTSALDIGQEYILAVSKFWILESEYSPSEPWRDPFTTEALDAAGGEAYSYNRRLTWVVESETAYKVPMPYFDGKTPEYTSHLEATRNGAFNLPLPTLEAVLRP